MQRQRRTGKYLWFCALEVVAVVANAAHLCSSARLLVLTVRKSKREYNVLVHLLIALLFLQASPLGQVRGDRFQILVPQGWRTLNGGGDVLIDHTTGASLLVRRIAQTKNLKEYAQVQAERVMTPLGFAKLGEPRFFKDGHDEWVQYEIRGNRLSEHRRILYRALHRDSGFFEFVYEAGEDQFDVLLTEAQGIASSVQAIIEAPPVRRPRR